MTDEPYQFVVAAAAWWCQRCGVLVHHSDEAKALHNEVHAREYWAEQHEIERAEREG